MLRTIARSFSLALLAPAALPLQTGADLPLFADEQEKFQAGNTQSGDRFGQSVSVDGDNVVIGAPGANQSGAGSGTAYVHHRIGTTWGAAIELVPNDGGPN